MGRDSHWSPRLGMSQLPPHPNLIIAALCTELRDDEIVPSLSLTVSEADKMNMKIFLIGDVRASPWSSRCALNTRPPRPKRGVLPTELLLDKKDEKCSTSWLPRLWPEFRQKLTVTWVLVYLHWLRTLSRPHASGETFVGAGYLQPRSFHL